MKYIDEKFKDEMPRITVQNIIQKLNNVGINLEEKWNNSQIENCCSLRVSVNGKMPGTNGKGISEEFARASAYGEFIERLQSGLFFYKYQSFENDESVYLHSFAPDGKYVSKEELLADSKWMQLISERYGITKETIASQCQMYACSDKILTLPYYSIFEDKYVYIPAAFVEHMYSANGVCVGNTKEEAWVHGLSEILERHSNIQALRSGTSVPIIPRERLKDFKAVNAILNRIEEEGIYDVEILDYSFGKKFPVIATRIINKISKGYLVNVGADPIFEIAVERTLTELFQGKNIKNFTSSNNGVILNKISDFNLSDNIINELETGNGLYTIDYFANNDNFKNDVDTFPDNTEKTNKELAKMLLHKFKDMGLQVYVRNNSFLGFPCYKFIVPGYSETRAERLKEPIPSYYFADRAAKTLRNIKKANTSALNELIMYHKMITNFISKKYNFVYLSGLPLTFSENNVAAIHFAYAALKLQNMQLFNTYISTAIKWTVDDKEKDYLLAVKQWVEFKNNGVTEEKAFAVIKRFYFNETYERLKKNVLNDALLDDYLVECGDCQKCKHKDICCYNDIREMIGKAGKEYSKFVNGQSREEFIF